MIGKPPTLSATSVYRWLDFDAYRKSTGSGLLTRQMQDLPSWDFQPWGVLPPVVLGERH